MSDTPQNKTRSRSGTLRRTTRDFIDLFLERWWIGALAGIVAGVLYVVLQPHRTPVYRTEVSLLFESRGDTTLGIKPVFETAGSICTAARSVSIAPTSLPMAQRSTRRE